MPHLTRSPTVANSASVPVNIGCTSWAAAEWCESLVSRDSAERYRADSDACVEADAQTWGDWRAGVGAIVDVVGIDGLFDQHFARSSYRSSGWMPLRNSASSSDSAAGSSS